jgi:DNA repair exonuclease SbcCD ATPase subunit
VILEGFEIENWSCIKRVAVDGLPPAGVVVLHGPNATGKSSIVAALRACLMDFAATSTSKDLKRWFAKDGCDKPRVSVAFRVQGASWRITKQFGSRDSKLESRSAAGSWKVEQSTAAEAHERVRQLVGDKDSDAGLQQLLWLNQAEFQLPDAKSFDSDVQSQLRGVLGVLQTPLDDRFIGRVKQEWSRWFGARSKPGERPKLKKDCPHDKALAALEQHKGELTKIEEEYQSFEKMMEKSGNLEIQSRDLRRQLAEKTSVHDLLQGEYEKSLKRLEAHRLAAARVETAERDLAGALERRVARADKKQRWREAARLAETAGRDVDTKGRLLQAAGNRLGDLRRGIHGLRHVGRGLQARLDRVSAHRRLVTLREQVTTAGESLRRVEKMADDLEKLRKQAREHPAPTAATIKKLEENRTSAGQARADLEAAAIVLTLMPEVGASTPKLSIDGSPAVKVRPATDETPIRRLVRRQAEIAIPGWGRAELTRGSDARSLDQIERELSDLDRQFAEGLAPFGLAADDTTGLDQLRALAAEKKARDPMLKERQEEINQLAPKGLDQLREEVARLEKLLSARDSDAETSLSSNDLPTAADALDQLAFQLKTEIEENEEKIRTAEQQVDEVEREIEGDPNADSGAVKKGNKADKNKSVVQGLRRQEADAKEALAGLHATAVVHREELGRMLTAEQIERAIVDAEKALGDARGGLEAARLSESEETIRERLEAAALGLRALNTQQTEAEKELNQIKGAMSQSEGLHQKRAAAAARVEELARQTERETLVSESYDRLYALFEECREKQLGTLMGPIHDRILRWMRLLRVGDFHSIRFNDQLLPERLVAGDGATEWTLGEQSIGTLEQIAMMVRLALGSMLSKPEEPAVAVLDDPLTHSDVVRLDRMRAVLKSASAGDAGSSPPAGPLQIIVFTCHPEWFAMDGAKIIDLSQPDVLSRRC